MEIFSLMAKLVLNKDEYDQSLKQAEADAHHVDDIEANLTLDDSDFDAKIASANSEDVDDIESELDLDDSDFTSKVDDANEAKVSDIESDLDLDASGFSAGVEQAEADGKSLAGSLGDTFDEIKGMLATAGITAAIAGIVSSLSEAVDLARSMGDNIDKSSRAMSLSTDAYQEWVHILDINGASITDLNRGLMNMRKLMGGGEASKEFTEGMDKLGLSAKVANGEITDTEQLLEASLKALADYEGTDRDYIAQAIFGRGGTKLNALFDGTSKDIESLKQQAHDLGLVMTEAEVSNAASYNDSVTNLKASMEAFKTSIVSEVLPVLTNVFNQAAKIVALFNWRTGDTSLAKQFEEIDKGSMDTLASIDMTESVAGHLADKLIAMGDASKLTAEQQAIWKGTAQELVSLIPSLSEIIDVDTLSISGNTDEIKENIKQWANLARERALAETREKRFKALVDRNTEAIDAQVKAQRELSEYEAAQDAARERIKEFLATGERFRGQDEYEARFGAGEHEITDEELEYWKGKNEFMTQAKTGEISKAWQEIDKQRGEYENAAEQAEKYRAEVEAGQKDFEEWEAAAAELFGVTKDTAGEAEDAVDDVGKAIDKLPSHKQVKIDLLVAGDMPHFIPKAKGDWNVPWDNFPALLHRGERVLTASQARQESSSDTNGAIVTAILGLRNDLQQLQLVVNGKTFGRAVVDYGGNRVDNYIGSSDSKLYSGYGI